MRQRIITGLIGGIGFLSLVWLGKEPYSILLLLLALIGFYEFIKMNNTNPFSLEAFIGFLFVSLAISSTGVFQVVPKISLANLIYFLLFSYLILIVWKKNKINFDQVASLMLGSMYIGLGFSYMLLTRNIQDGLQLTLLVLLATWASDSGAYFTGKYFGKHKLWPEISPKKTIEGSIGGILLAITVSIIYNEFTNITEHTLLITWAGIAISVIGQIGDLVESALKRSKEIKDSGNILPGHGGILDRFDSLIFVFPILHFLHII